MDALSQALAIALTPSIFGVLALGVVGGILVGAAPGLTSTIAIGLLIPFTYGVSKYVAFALLLGIYCGSLYGGSIPAVLMNLPGTPSSAVTAIDGFAMTRKGRGGEALAITVIAAMLGGLISSVFLIALAPKLAFLATAFAAPEYFSLCVFALCVVFSMTGSSILKSIIATGVGLLLSTVGVDPIAPVERFTLGFTVLAIGVPVVPTTIALFCAAEALRLIFLPPDAERVSEQEAKSTFAMAIAQGRNLWRSIFRSSLIGTAIGILPATGAVMAGLISYGVAKRASKTPETFGQGNPEGVAASQAAESSVTGGALIPMLTLGIPGDTNTLMMLGAMLVLGLVPGPSLFTEERTLMYVIFIFMILSYILILIFGLRFGPWIARATRIDKRYIVPVVLVLAITGPAISEGHIYYYWLAIVFGVLGFLYERAQFPVIAMAMGIVLGPIIEQNLRGALMLPEPVWKIFLARPISAAFLVLSVLIVALGVYRALAAREGMDKPSPENP
jgi:putative tricarboxylic transport membrane protein